MQIQNHSDLIKELKKPIEFNKKGQCYGCPDFNACIKFLGSQSSKKIEKIYNIIHKDNRL